MRETEAIARRLRVRLAPDVVEKALSFMDRNGPNIKASMQLDVEAGRRTELESIIGLISRKGRELDTRDAGGGHAVRTTAADRPGGTVAISAGTKTACPAGS